MKPHVRLLVCCSVRHNCLKRQVSYNSNAQVRELLFNSGPVFNSVYFVCLFVELVLVGRVLDPDFLPEKKTFCG